MVPLPERRTRIPRCGSGLATGRILTPLHLLRKPGETMPCAKKGVLLRKPGETVPCAKKGVLLRKPGETVPDAKKGVLLRKPGETVPGALQIKKL